MVIGANNGANRSKNDGAYKGNGTSIEWGLYRWYNTCQQFIV